VADVEKILDAIVRTSGDAVITADSSGRITSWNPSAEKIFGYRSDDVIGALLTTIIPERYRQQHEAGIARVASGGQTRIIGKTVAVEAVRKDGSEVPIELSLATGQSNGETFFAAIARDVSHRVKLISDLKNSEARLESILESANDAIITISSAGEVKQWNACAEGLFGRTKEEMLGQNLLSIIPERYRALHEEGLRRVTGGGDRHAVGRTVELSGLKKDGSEFPMELSLAVWKSGEDIFYSGIIRDITERKAAGERLQQVNSELADKNKMLEGLSAKLAKYLSRQVYDSIFEGKTEVRVASYRKRLTIFFSDIQGFTELSDRLEPEPVSRLLNGYLSDMSDIAMEHGGTVDKFIGDGIMIFFGDPETSGEREDAIACARMALAMRDRDFELKSVWREHTGSIDLHVRMGINTGYCTVGNFGSSERMDYTIVGREVNTASRLESTAKEDQIQIASDTYELIKDEFDCRPVGEIKVKGLAYPVTTFELVGPKETMDTEASADVLSQLGINLQDMSAEKADAAREALATALERLNRHSDTKKE
jgi:adenylate cyclase